MASYFYYGPVAGRVVERYGTGTFIGAQKTKTKFVQNLAVVVRIPTAEHEKYASSYAQAVRHGDLVERSEADYDNSQAASGAPGVLGEAGIPESEPVAVDAAGDEGPQAAEPEKKSRRNRA